MLTRCPDCQTLFRIRAETLRVAHGRVRCGRCGAEFNALDSLAEDPDALPGEVATVNEEAVRADVEHAVDTGESGAQSPQDTVRGGPIGPPVEADVADREQPEAETALPSTEGASAAEPDSEAESPVAAEDRVTPAIAPEVIHSLLLDEEPRRARAGPGLAAGAATLLLLAALAGQWLYLQRVPLYAQPSLRPVLERMCLRLNCELPLPRAPERIEVVERIVREHPRVAQALLVDLTIVSRADGLVAYPLLELRLSDISGNRIAARRFTPAEYLPAHVNVRAGLAQDAPVQVTLELLAPHIEAVSFQFDFL